jgi:hypothetical protein
MIESQACLATNNHIQAFTRHCENMPCILGGHKRVVIVGESREAVRVLIFFWAEKEKMFAR